LEIFFPQSLHRPFKRKKLKIGILSYHLMVLPQLWQKDLLGFVMDMFSSSYLNIITFKKLPVTAPTIKLKKMPKKTKMDHLKIINLV